MTSQKMPKFHLFRRVRITLFRLATRETNPICPVIEKSQFFCIVVLARWQDGGYSGIAAEKICTKKASRMGRLYRNYRIKSVERIGVLPVLFRLTDHNFNRTG